MTDQRSSGQDPDPALTPASASDALSEAFAGAARRAGLDPNAGHSTGHVVWHAMGGWRGMAEAALPGIVFIAVYTLTMDAKTGDGNLGWSLGLSVGMAAVFTIIRLFARQPVTSAVSGLLAVAVAAAFAIFTGEASNNFIPGFITNVLYGAAFLISALAGWSLIGLAVGFLMGEGTAWRRDRRKRRAFFWLAIAWAGLFAARLLVQFPLYLADNVTALGTLKLVMGIPLFAPLLAVTYLVVRALYPPAAKTDVDIPE